jgi:hypothetical protein
VLPELKYVKNTLARDFEIDDPLNEDCVKLFKANCSFVVHVPAGGCGGSGLAPPMPAVAESVAGTEPRRRRGGVRLMLNRVNLT